MTTGPTWLDTPVGRLAVEAGPGGIQAIRWLEPTESPTVAYWPSTALALEQLAVYFERRRTRFDLPLDPIGTPFQRRVWQALTAIPHGRTLTYGALADRVGSGPRAVARACGANPIPIIVPCHRVVGATSEGGFSAPGGRATKRWLLTLEGAPRQLSLLGELDDPQ